MNRKAINIIISAAIIASFTACGKSNSVTDKDSQVKIIDQQESKKSQIAEPATQSSGTSTTTYNSEKNSKEAEKQEKAKVSKQPATNSTQTTKNSKTITYEDQVQVENAIKAFSDASKNGNYEAAFKYCSPELRAHFNSVVKNGTVASSIDLVIKDNLPLELISIKGYIPSELTSDNKPNYNVTRANPTTHFIVKFDYISKDGKKHDGEYYVDGTKVGGKWYIGGFATGM